MVMSKHAPIRPTASLWETLRGDKLMGLFYIITKMWDLFWVSLGRTWRVHHRSGPWANCRHWKQLLDTLLMFQSATKDKIYRLSSVRNLYFIEMVELTATNQAITANTVKPMMLLFYTVYICSRQDEVFLWRFHDVAAHQIHRLC